MLIGLAYWFNPVFEPFVFLSKFRQEIRKTGPIFLKSSKSEQNEVLKKLDFVKCLKNFFFKIFNLLEKIAEFATLFQNLSIEISILIQNI